MAPEVKPGTNYNLYTSYEIWNMLKISHEKNKEEKKKRNKNWIRIYDVLRHYTYIYV